ncbi:MAG: PPM-type phosphatase protein [Bacteroidota bacterium]|nr:PPM-type phosphatase protein [Bacteroidota bacterium]
MQYYTGINQRNIYKLVENLTSGIFKNELGLLKSLIKSVVKHKEFEIIGGRVWELCPAEGSYILKYQYGSLPKIPKGYSIQLTDHQETFSKLIRDRAALNYETDKVLLEKGIQLYSVIGVGDIIKVKGVKYYKYTLGFNAPEILQSFFETLSVISSVVSVALRNMENQARQSRLNRDMVKASEIQKSLLPEHHLRFFDYDIYGICLPDSEVGGDYFDYLKSTGEDDEHLGIVISDAASKGLPAAIQALFVSGAFRMATAFSPKIATLLSRLNTLIFDTFPYERFVTLCYLDLTISSNRLILYANAGHCAPIHYRSEDGKISYLSATGGLLGLVRNQKFKVENLTMKCGDVIALYTDGITEANNSEGKIFGEERLCELIRRNAGETPQNIALNIIEEIQKFTVDSIYSDDKTLVIIKRVSDEAGKI